MVETFKEKKFYIFFILATVLVFLIFINLNRTYKSQTDILIIFKSEKAAKNADIILENLAILPKSLSFYDRITQEEEDVKNEAVSELPDYKRKKYWDEIMRIERVGKSSFLSFIATDKDQYMAEVLSTQTVNGLIGVIGVYYDIKNDIDIRIIDGPVTKNSFSGSYIFYFIESIILGFILSFASNYFLFLFTRIKPKEKTKANLAWSYRDTQKDITEKKSIIASEEFIPIFSKKATAPDNLPIAEDIPTFEQTKEEVTEVKIEKNPLVHEATAEEVKERLNKLLSGKL